MRTVEIPRKDWAQALRNFSATHEGSLISVEVLGPTIGAQTEINHLPLLGVSADPANRDDTITISAARSAAEHITHAIHGATRLYVERREDGADVALQIESADGTKDILRFRAAALPETLNDAARR